MGAPPELLAAHQARVRALPLVKLRARLIESARGRGASKGAAEELANSAILKLWAKGAEKWNFARDPDAYYFLVDALRLTRRLEAKKTMRRRTDINTEVVEEVPPSSDRGAAGTLLDRERATRARDELLRRVASSPLTVRVVQLCMEEGELRPSEIAERLGESVKRIYECQRRIGEEIEAIQAEYAKADADEDEEKPR